MLTDAVTYLKNSDDVWKTSIIGGVLLLFGFLLIPLFIVWGYILRVLDRTAHGDDDAPVFEDWGELTVDGAKAFVVLLAYSLVPVVVGSVLIGSVWLATGDSPGSATAAGTIFGGLVTLVLFVAVAYVTPAALAHVASERRIGAGFEFETLRPVLSSGTYAARWLLALGIVLVGSFVGGLLNVVPFLGAVLGAIVGFYALVAAYYVIGHAWGDLHVVAVDDRDDDRSSERAAV
ncbi:DUF4013 domain-containing protein [Natronobeatus ordinarius]|uniref:DUF4013 domain-containing protein n=1 Tax=Natronobeatus ordinarius TaxID=2963433 RepID=UPI0020CD5A21|nr:DUF4013 domain-containing protein [Natronobeatus ordinarius]